MRSNRLSCDRRVVLNAIAAAALLTLADATPAQVDAWPGRPIRMIVPSAPGSGSDVLIRAISEKLSIVLRQPIVIDNRPGASGMIGTSAVAKAAADGYTLLYTNASFTVMLQALQPELKFDSLQDIAPVALTAVGGVVLLVTPDIPAKTLPELVALLKADPAKYGYGSWGVGSNDHLTMEWLKSKTGLGAEHVAYKGVPPLLNDMLSGVLKIGWSDPSTPLPHLATGRLRAIAVNGTARAPRLPDVATMGEQGFAFPAVGWQGIFAPQGTPAAVSRRINDEVQKILASDEMRAMMSRMNLEPTPPWSSERFARQLREDLSTWKAIVSDGKIRMDP